VSDSHPDHRRERDGGESTASAHAAEAAAAPAAEHTAVPIAAAVVTVSDSGFAGTREDTSGDVLEELLRELGAVSVERRLVPDEAETIAAQLRDLADGTAVNLVLTTGGTGFTSRDVTPEATLSVIEREAPGIAEAMRFVSLQKTPRAMLSRGVSGLRGRTLIVNMPGSPRACREQFEIIREALPHGIEKLLDSGGDCARPDEPPRR
jgi:molybdopterin adenylyltransferase